MTQKNGSCQKRKIFYGSITITEKGQLAIPIELRRELKIEKGDKLLVIKRKDGQGFNLIKEDSINNFLNKLSNN
jgi:AbrB family looped-hinge helix DNA binding protein